MILGRSKEILTKLASRNITLISVIICCVFVFIALFGQHLVFHDPFKTNLRSRFKAPSLTYPFGTDQLGRCLLSRIIYGTRFTFSVGFFSVAIAGIAGVIIGLFATMARGIMGRLVMMLMDLMLVFPYFLLCLSLVAVLGPSLKNIIIAVGVWMIPHFARLTRGQVLSVRERDYVLAARMIGEKELWVILRYIFPNCLSPLIVQATLYLPRAIMIGAALGFLGLGARPPLPEWGVMLSGAREYITTAPYLTIFPAMAVLVLTIGFNILGDGLRDVLDPRLQDVI